MKDLTKFTRKISLSKPLNRIESQRLLRLSDLPAVEMVRHTSKRIVIRYDARHLQWPVLWQLLRRYHLPLQYSLRHHLRYRLYRLLDRGRWDQTRAELSAANAKQNGTLDVVSD